MSPEFFQQELAKKGIKIGSSKDDQETIGNKTYKVFLYKDGKGDPISSRDLGPEFMVNGIFERISKKQEAEEERINIEKCKKVYDATMAGTFAYYKGSATEVSKYLKGLQPDDKENIINRIGQDYGTKGTFYVQSRLQADINKNEFQLAADRDKLRRDGHDIKENPGDNLSQNIKDMITP